MVKTAKGAVVCGGGSGCPPPCRGSRRSSGERQGPRWPRDTTFTPSLRGQLTFPAVRTLSVPSLAWVWSSTLVERARKLVAARGRSRSGFHQGCGALLDPATFSTEREHANAGRGVKVAIYSAGWSIVDTLMLTHQEGSDVASSSSVLASPGCAERSFAWVT